MQCRSYGGKEVAVQREAQRPARRGRPGRRPGQAAAVRPLLPGHGLPEGCRPNIMLANFIYGVVSLSPTVNLELEPTVVEHPRRYVWKTTKRGGGGNRARRPYPF